jgi:hypothetical protein
MLESATATIRVTTADRVMSAAARAVCVLVASEVTLFVVALLYINLLSDYGYGSPSNGSLWPATHRVAFGSFAVTLIASFMWRHPPRPRFVLPLFVVLATGATQSIVPAAKRSAAELCRAPGDSLQNCFDDSAIWLLRPQYTYTFAGILIGLAVGAALSVKRDEYRPSPRSN